MDPLQPLEAAAEGALRQNQVLWLLSILIMLNEVDDLTEAKARIQAVIDTLLD